MWNSSSWNQWCNCTLIGWTHASTSAIFDRLSVNTHTHTHTHGKWDKWTNYTCKYAPKEGRQHPAGWRAPLCHEWRFVMWYITITPFDCDQQTARFSLSLWGPLGFHLWPRPQKHSFGERRGGWCNCSAWKCHCVSVLPTQQETFSAPTFSLPKHHCRKKTHAPTFSGRESVCLWFPCLFPFSLLEYSFSLALSLPDHPCAVFVRWPLTYLFIQFLVFSSLFFGMFVYKMACLQIDRIQPTRLSGDLDLKSAWAWIGTAAPLANKR